MVIPESSRDDLPARSVREKYYATPGYTSGMHHLTLAAALLPTLAATGSPVELGRMDSSRVASPIVVAAPHGGFDRYSEVLAREVALMSGASYLIAEGYRTHEHLWNVNRPTEGVKLRVDAEPVTDAATAVYRAYARKLSGLAPRMYVEIHGNSRPESAGWIETATQGLSAEEALWLKRDFEARVARMPADIPRFALKVEPLDQLHYRASSVKKQGVFQQVPIAVHFETPWALRADERTRVRYAAALAGSIEGLWQHKSSK